MSQNRRFDHLNAGSEKNGLYLKLPLEHLLFGEPAQKYQAWRSKKLQSFIWRFYSFLTDFWWFLIYKWSQNSLK